MQALKLLPVVALVFVFGCAAPSWATTPTDTPIPLEPTVSGPPSTPPQFVNWLSPSKVTISDFRPGAMAEYPITFHNAKLTTTDRKQVTTGENETVAGIPLNSAGLYLSDIASVIGLTSNNPEDDVRVTGYDERTNSLVIIGFAAKSTRILTVTYKPMTAYSVYARLPDTVAPTESMKMAREWVLVANPTLVMAPLDTVEDTVTVSMPSDAVAPDKTWEFWVGVSEVKQSSGAAVSLELVSRWIVNMKAN